MTHFFGLGLGHFMAHGPHGGPPSTVQTVPAQLRSNLISRVECKVYDRIFHSGMIAYFATK